MWNLLDIPEVFITYITILIALTALNVVFFINQKKARVLPKLGIFTLILLLGTFTFHIIDSIPYLYISIWVFPLENIVRSTLILISLGVEFVIFHYALYYRALAIFEENKKNV